LGAGRRLAADVAETRRSLVTACFSKDHITCSSATPSIRSSTIQKNLYLMHQVASCSCIGSKNCSNTS
jgi:hypothetical protein